MRWMVLMQIWLSAATKMRRPADSAVCMAPWPLYPFGPQRTEDII